MHAVFVACLFGGAMATALFAVLGFVGGAGGHGPHSHIGHGAHGQAGHAHVGGHVGPGGHAQTAGHGHLHSGNGGHSLADRGGQAGRAGGGQGSAPVGSGQTAVAHATALGRLGSSAGWALSWFSPLTLAAAALWFGGGGLLAEGIVGPLALVIAIIAAVVGAGLVRAAMNVFLRASTPPLQLTAEGAIGTVNASIKPGGTGEVIYTLEELHRSLPARSDDGKPIKRGTSVVILRCERGIAWVTPLDPLEEVQSDVGPAMRLDRDSQNGSVDDATQKMVDSSG